ncbi:MAG: hypothetical protein JNL52_13185 [Flavobacteriales bacterium]|nr:hypothetical protein [Flavobacteriales bacterium]
MIVRALLILLVLYCGSVQAQPPAAMRKTIKTLQTELARYDTLSPFSDEPGATDTIEALGTRIMERLRVLLSDPRSVIIDLEKEFRGRIGMTLSPDGRLAHFHLPENTGGTFRANYTLLYMRTKGSVWAGQPNTLDAETEDGSTLDGGTVEIVASGIGSWDDIIQLDDSTYFTVERVTTCSTCCAYSAIGLRLKGTTVHILGVHDYEGRFFDVELFELDPATASFHYAYYDEWTSDEPPQLLERTLYTGVVRYVNGRFVTTEACESRR